MVDRAGELVPGATFLRGDVAQVDEVDFEAATYRARIESAGLTIDDERFVPEGSGGHTLFVATPAPGRLSP